MPGFCDGTLSPPDMTVQREAMLLKDIDHRGRHGGSLGVGEADREDFATKPVTCQIRAVSK